MHEGVNSKTTGAPEVTWDLAFLTHLTHKITATLFHWCEKWNWPKSRAPKVFFFKPRSTDWILNDGDGGQQAKKSYRWCHRPTLQPTTRGRQRCSSQFNKYIPLRVMNWTGTLGEAHRVEHEACFGGDVAPPLGDSKLLLQYREVISGLGFKTGYQSGNQPSSIDCQVWLDFHGGVIKTITCSQTLIPEMTTQHVTDFRKYSEFYQFSFFSDRI